MGKNKNDRSPVLVRLFNNKNLLGKVDHALSTGMSYADIIELCREYEFEISKSALSRYQEKRQEALETGVPLESLLDKRRKTGKVIDLVTKETKNELSISQGEEEPAITGTVEKVYSDLEFLDELIAKAKEGLKYVDTVEIPFGIKAIDTKAKITGNQLQGLSVVGLRELNLRRMAKEHATTEVLLKYIPKEQHEAVLSEMEQREQEFYQNMDLTEEDKRITDALTQAGFTL